MKRPAMLLVLALTLPVAAAQQPASPSETENLDGLVDYWNQRAGAVPGPIHGLLGEERVNLNLTAGNASVVMGVVMDGLMIDRIQEQPVQDPTLSVTMDVETLAAIASAENPGRRAVQALREGDIRYEAEGIAGKIVFGGMVAFVQVWAALTG